MMMVMMMMMMMVVVVMMMMMIIRNRKLHGPSFFVRDPVGDFGRACFDLLSA